MCILLERIRANIFVISCLFCPLFDQYFEQFDGGNFYWMILTIEIDK